MRLAVLQSPSPEGDLEHALATLDRALRTAAAARADVLVAPEVFLPGYNQPDLPASALADDVPVLRQLAQSVAAAGTALVVGYAEAHGTQVFNTALCLGPDGREIARYRKTQLFGARERRIYAPGDSYVVFDLGGRKAALLICYDVEFAPHVAALSAMGVEVLLVPTANMEPFDHVVKFTVPAMAANYAMTIAYANYCGAEGDLHYVGGSLVVGPHGEILAQAGTHPAMIVADVPKIDSHRKSTQAQDLRVLTQVSDCRTSKTER